MKTTLRFTESMDKRIVILKHDKDIRITKETRKDHMEWRDMDGKLLEQREYIVIRFPKNKNIDTKKLKIRAEYYCPTGYVVREKENEIEILLYDQVTFCWVLYDLEKAGIWKVSQRLIPKDGEEELFSYYLNARGVKEYSFNIAGVLLQIPYNWYQKKEIRKKTI